ncbi:DUF4244 domain-containing protein [Parafrankia discariae]|uniref:DUF4244 domain-containing protein n=1 Tax=Parafrankia discariae TaxID=365528 RepID=UPI00054D7146|nr:DUF4244 domain-containing protein [Parafrankia discariae]
MRARSARLSLNPEATMLFLYVLLRPPRSTPSARPWHRRWHRSRRPNAGLSTETGRPTEPRRSTDAGMSTAEYAVGTLAAVAFAGVLYAVVSSSATRSLISSVVQRALTATF